MRKSFHENVGDNYAEWFITDLIKNLEMFIDMSQMLNGEDMSKSGRKKLVKRLKGLKAVINEEIDMLGALQDERTLSKAEKRLFNEVKKLRSSGHIKRLENLTR